MRPTQKSRSRTNLLPRMDLSPQVLLDAIPFYVLLIDAEHKILLANKALKRDLGLDPQEIIGGFCPQVVHGIQGHYPGCPLEQALEQGGSVVREYFSPEKKRWVSSAIYPTGRSTSEGNEIFLHFVTDITQRKTAEEEVRRNYETQTVINTLLRLSLQDMALEDLLDRTLELILSIPWLGVESKGSIFIVGEEPDVLVMRAQRGLPGALRKRCARIPFGTCLCGRAASAMNIKFSPRIDAQHEIRHKGMMPHGHYCIPILFSEKTVGVINLYLPKGHEPSQGEAEFLTAIANALSGILARKRIDDALKSREKELEIKTGSLEEMNSALKVLLKRREEDRKELEEKILFNVKELVVHYVDRLRDTLLDGRQSGYLDVLESNLNNIISPFSRALSNQFLNLTPMEIEIADLVRQGKRTKEMADLLNVSQRTIEFHRQNIRRKLGLREKKANLRTRLISLQE